MDEGKKRAVAGLWAVPGIGPMAVAKVERLLGLANLTDTLIGEWLDLVPDLPAQAVRCIPRGRTLGELGDELLKRAARHHMKIAWHGEREYPALLAETASAPPLLFYWGPGTDAPARRRLAMVGTRNPDPLCIETLKPLIAGVAARGIGIVSGAARGIDAMAHRGAAANDGETWAFIGSALDQMDPPQANLWHQVKRKGATFWTELPPGVRSAPQNYPRRNRLITGASNALAVLRADLKSGTKHSVWYARQQGRPMLAVPGPPDAVMAEMCNALIKFGFAKMFTHVSDAMQVLGVTGYASHTPAPVTAKAVELTSLSADAQATYAAIDRVGVCFDDLLPKLEMRSTQLLTALFELVTSGHVIEHTGRRYERVA